MLRCGWALKTMPSESSQTRKATRCASIYVKVQDSRSRHRKCLPGAWGLLSGMMDVF